MSMTEYDFLEGHRVKISWRDTEEHNNKHLLGYCSQVEHPNSSNVKIYVILDDGKVSWMIPRHKDVEGVKMDITARIINPGKVHKAFAVTGAICLGSAAAILGTNINGLVKDYVSRGGLIIGHPQGVIKVEIETNDDGGQVGVESASIFRTARVIMEGYVHVPSSVFK